MDRASAQFCKMLDYILAAHRLETAAVEYDAVTAGRLKRLAVSFRERASRGMGTDFRSFGASCEPPFGAERLHTSDTIRTGFAAASVVRCKDSQGSGLGMGAPR